MKLALQSIEDLIHIIIGEDVIPLTKILHAKDNISEFKLAEMLNVTVNQTRNMLYRLNEQNLVSFIRKKDKKKGWYIYYWSLNKKRVGESIVKVKQKQFECLVHVPQYSANGNELLNILLEWSGNAPEALSHFDMHEKRDQF